MVDVFQFPRGDASQEDAVTSPSGTLRVDLTRGGLHVHDGVKQGGFYLPNVDQVSALVAAQLSGATSVGSLVIVDSVAALKDVAPSSSVVAVIAGTGLEEAYVWHSGAGDQGTIASNVSGVWRRLDDAVGLMIRLWRANFVNLQVGGAVPSANQDVTAWIDNGVTKLWDGGAYIAATPATFARLLASIGNYYSGATSFPTRLAAQLNDIADLNAPPDDSGWFRTTAGAANSPIAGVHVVEYRKIDANSAMQILHVQDSANRDQHIRFKVAGAWGGWTLVPGLAAARLGAVSLTVADANTALDSGFYNIAAAGANIPVAANSVLYVNRYSATEAAQILIVTGGTLAIYMRKYLASAWGAWAPLSDLATAAQINSGAAGKVVTADQAIAAADYYVQAYAGSLTFDHANGPNQKVTLAGNPTVNLPANPKVGLPLNIRFLQDGTGSRVPAFASNFDFGDYGTMVLSTGANQEDIASFICISATKYAFMGMRKRID